MENCILFCSVDVEQDYCYVQPDTWTSQSLWDRKLERAVCLVEHCVKYSKNQPLFLAIHSSASGRVGGVEVVERILAVLGAEAERSDATSPLSKSSFRLT